MAISPKDTYPGQVDTSDPTGYPEGAAKNVTDPGEGDGTPWERDLANDILGFQQALLDAASLSPSGTPEKVGASQYLDAVRDVADQQIADVFFEPGDERIVSDEWTYPDAKTRVRTLSAFSLAMIAGNAGEGAAWYRPTDQPYLASDVSTARLILPLNDLLPAGSTITLIRILLKPGADRTAQGSTPGDNGRMWAALHSIAMDFDTPGVTPQGPFFAEEDAGGTDDQTVTITPSPAWAIGTKVAADSMLVLHAGDDAGTNVDLVYGVEITYTDAGPRNL